MKFLRITLKAVGYLLALCLGLAVTLYAWAAIANWRDDPLSEDTQRALQYTPPTEAQLQDNGYLIIAGLDAAMDAVSTDAAQAASALGRQRLQREIERRDWAMAHPLETVGMPPTIPGALRDKDVLPEALRCPNEELNCIAWYEQNRAAIALYLASSQALLRRVQAAVQTQQFANYAPPFALYTDLPPFPLLVRSHELWLAQAALEWASGQQTYALQTVTVAAQLRQRIADSSNTLIATMVALAMQYRELRWLSNAMQHSTPTTSEAVRASLDQLLTPNMPPTQAALEGEKQFMAGVYQSIQSHGSAEVFSDFGTADANLWWAPWLSKLTSIAYLQQATINSAVTHLQAMQQLSSLPASSLDSQYNAYLERYQEQKTCGAFWRQMRNAVGNCLLAIGTPAYLGYMQRIADVDGYRRLVALQHQAMTAGVAASDMAQWLQQSPPALRNPYTLQPMLWDATNNSLVFEGKAAQPLNPDSSRTYRVRLFSTRS